MIFDVRMVGEVFSSLRLQIDNKSTALDSARDRNVGLQDDNKVLAGKVEALDK